MEDSFKFDLNYCIKNGALVGAVFGAISILLYVIDEALLANGILGIVLLLAMAVIFAVVGIKYRNTVAGGFMSYGQAYKVLFVTIFSSIVVSTLFNVILFHLIDTGLSDRIMEIAVQNAESMMRRFGATEEQIQETATITRENDNYTISAQLMGILYVGVIGNAIITLILAAIAKKNPDSEEF